MQRPCLSVATKRVELVDRRECAAVAVHQVYKLVSGRARANAEPPHSSQEFREFPHLLAPDSATELPSSQRSVYGISLSQPC